MFDLVGSILLAYIGGGTCLPHVGVTLANSVRTLKFSSSRSSAEERLNIRSPFYVHLTNARWQAEPIVTAKKYYSWKINCFMVG